MSLRRHPRADRPANAREADRRGPREDLELPRPWRLALTAGWNLAESLGLPVAGYLLGAVLGGLLAISALMLTLQTALVIATGSTLFFLLQFPLANLALCVLFARTATTRKPLVAQLAAEVVGLRLPSPRHPGLDRFFQEATWLWAAIFAASTAGLAAALAIASASTILLLSTVVTTGGAAAGAFLCILWFIRVLRRFGLHVRFTQA
jgi:hypothetical protein